MLGCVCATKCLGRSLEPCDASDGCRTTYVDDHTHMHAHSPAHTHTHPPAHCNNSLSLSHPFFPFAQVESSNCSKALPAINGFLGILQGTADGDAPVMECDGVNKVSTPPTSTAVTSPTMCSCVRFNQRQRRRCLFSSRALSMWVSPPVSACPFSLLLTAPPPIFNLLLAAVCL